MLRKYFVLITMAASLSAGPITARAQDAGALLDLLVRKKLITEQEAQSVRAELSKERGQNNDSGKESITPVTASVNSGEKWKLSTPLTELELYGDVRLRYEYRGGRTDDQDPGHAPSTARHLRERRGL